MIEFRKNYIYKTSDYVEKKEINKNDCSFLYKKLSICMKNSDDNIILCQDMRNIFEDCLKNENKKK